MNGEENPCWNRRINESGPDARETLKLTINNTFCETIEKLHSDMHYDKFCVRLKKLVISFTFSLNLNFKLNARQSSTNVTFIFHFIEWKMSTFALAHT